MGLSGAVVRAPVGPRSCHLPPCPFGPVPGALPVPPQALGLRERIRLAPATRAYVCAAPLPSLPTPTPPFSSSLSGAW